jgi:hypothetical protein
MITKENEMLANKSWMSVPGRRSDEFDDQVYVCAVQHGGHFQQFEKWDDDLLIWQSTSAEFCRNVEAAWVPGSKSRLLGVASCALEAFAVIPPIQNLQLKFCWRE